VARRTAAGATATTAGGGDPARPACSGARVCRVARSALACAAHL